MMGHSHHGLAQVVGWVSVIAFLLGVIAALTGREIIVAGNDYWQASLYLVLFAIFASLAERKES